MSETATYWFQKIESVPVPSSHVMQKLLNVLLSKHLNPLQFISSLHHHHEIFNDQHFLHVMAYADLLNQVLPTITFEYFDTDELFDVILGDLISVIMTMIRFALSCGSESVQDRLKVVSLGCNTIVDLFGQTELYHIVLVARFNNPDLWGRQREKLGELYEDVLGCGVQELKSKCSMMWSKFVMLDDLRVPDGNYSKYRFGDTNLWLKFTLIDMVFHPCAKNIDHYFETLELFRLKNKMTRSSLLYNIILCCLEAERSTREFSKENNLIRSFLISKVPTYLNQMDEYFKCEYISKESNIYSILSNLSTLSLDEIDMAILSKFTDNCVRNNVMSIDELNSMSQLNPYISRLYNQDVSMSEVMETGIISKEEDILKLKEYLNSERNAIEILISNISNHNFAPEIVKEIASIFHLSSNYNSEIISDICLELSRDTSNIDILVSYSQSVQIIQSLILRCEMYGQNPDMFQHFNGPMFALYYILSSLQSSTPGYEYEFLFTQIEAPLFSNWYFLGRKFDLPTEKLFAFQGNLGWDILLGIPYSLKISLSLLSQSMESNYQVIIDTFGNLISQFPFSAIPVLEYLLTELTLATDSFRILSRFINDIFHFCVNNASLSVYRIIPDILRKKIDYLFTQNPELLSYLSSLSPFYNKKRVKKFRSVKTLVTSIYSDLEKRGMNYDPSYIQNIRQSITKYDAHVFVTSLMKCISEIEIGSLNNYVKEQQHWRYGEIAGYMVYIHSTDAIICLLETGTEYSLQVLSSERTATSFVNLFSSALFHFNMKSCSTRVEHALRHFFTVISSTLELVDLGSHEEITFLLGLINNLGCSDDILIKYAPSKRLSLAIDRVNAEAVNIRLFSPKTSQGREALRKYWIT